jgi:hypothetical protein
MTLGPISFRPALPVSGFSTRHFAALPSCHSTSVGVLPTAVPTQGYGITGAITVAAGILTTVRSLVGQTEASQVQAQVRAVAQVRGVQVQAVDRAWEAAQARAAAVALVRNLPPTQRRRFDNLMKCLLAEGNSQ